jgi:hypothetical protein
MKALMIIIRVIVALTMPMIGYFAVESGEGVFQAFIRYDIVDREIRGEAHQSPSPILAAKVETLEALRPRIDRAKSSMERVALVGGVLCLVVCGLAMWAGEIVKDLRKQQSAPSRPD